MREGLSTTLQPTATRSYSRRVMPSGISDLDHDHGHPTQRSGLRAATACHRTGQHPVHHVIRHRDRRPATVRDLRDLVKVVVTVANRPDRSQRRDLSPVLGCRRRASRLRCVRNNSHPLNRSECGRRWHRLSFALIRHYAIKKCTWFTRMNSSFRVQSFFNSPLDQGNHPKREQSTSNKDC